MIFLNNYATAKKVFLGCAAIICVTTGSSGAMAQNHFYFDMRSNPPSYSNPDYRPRYRPYNGQTTSTFEERYYYSKKTTTTYE